MGQETHRCSYGGIYGTRPSPSVAGSLSLPSHGAPFPSGCAPTGLPFHEGSPHTGLALTDLTLTLNTCPAWGSRCSCSGLSPSAAEVTYSSA